MSIYWSETVKRLEPYVPGEQPRDRKYIKLNTNENPYPPSPRVLEAIKQAVNGDLRLYPDPACTDLCAAAAEYYGLKKEQVFPANGSDELLAFAFQAFFNPGNPILFPDITYTFYEVYCNLFNIDYRLIPLDDDFRVPVKEFYARNGGVVIANPNAPTARYEEIDSIRSILEHNLENVVIVDEAYIDFGCESAVKLINEYPNLLVIQTLSKSRSLAGLRIGLAFGNEDLIRGIDRVKNSFNSYTLDRLALAGAAEALRDRDYFEDTRKKIINTRERISKQLELRGFRVVPSLANFIFISHPDFDAECIFKLLKENGILVRYFKKPRIDNFLRVSIGTDEDMDNFLNVLDDIMNRIQQVK